MQVRIQLFYDRSDGPLMLRGHIDCDNIVEANALFNTLTNLDLNALVVVGLSLPNNRLVWVDPSVILSAADELLQSGRDHKSVRAV